LGYDAGIDGVVVVTYYVLLIVLGNVLLIDDLVNGSLGYDDVATCAYDLVNVLGNNGSCFLLYVYSIQREALYLLSGKI
jgi:hypothetical protein